MTDCVTEPESGTRKAEGERASDATRSAENVAIERIRERGESVRDRQVERALSELELSEHERDAVERLGDRLVERLLAVPEAQLERAASDGDDETLAAALELFSGSR
ncbi:MULTISPECIES: hypothetical protein [Halomicrobium]|uniref:Tetrapyrrole biosynthesis glutamyl-tRNA reductase dimerisation domain-containing protein n=1 Tax=Halomicrobium mukohataei TaxID=57705 RepID=A0A847UDG7_9EURY|nr:MULTISPECIES: hypothetical protein [Halomicrobium]NLV10277.1 hypothetical protein [Halomicrobium mukohataei]QGA82353.1 Glutamyl-tRNAGlu reductase, dimerization domain [Halomicrobium sp. LC1Hm]